MTLSDTAKAIGAVTELLSSVVQSSVGSGIDVTVGRPELQAVATTHPRLNLFLYEIHFDEFLKNLPLDEGQQPPLWLVLRYMMTAFDSQGESDNIEAHNQLGQGIRALQGLNFLSMRSSGKPALINNPENLKITFNESSYELLGKIMQGSDEKYRLSISFEVRPVMIASPEPPSYSLLVGVDYTKDPPLNTIGEDGINIETMTFFGSSITSLYPTQFEANSLLTIFGDNMNLASFVTIDSLPVKINSQRPDRVQCVINGNISTGDIISAGSKPICVVQNLPNGKQRSSNILVGNLLPTLTSVQIVPGSTTKVDPASNNSKLYVSIDLTGILLGDINDEIFVGLYQNGKTVKIFSDFSITTPQTNIRLCVNNIEDAVTPGKYRVILIVNGQQAKYSPEIEFVEPP